MDLPEVRYGADSLQDPATFLEVSSGFVELVSRRVDRPDEGENDGDTSLIVDLPIELEGRHEELLPGSLTFPSVPPGVDTESARGLGDEAGIVELPCQLVGSSELLEGFVELRAGGGIENSRRPDQSGRFEPPVIEVPGQLQGLCKVFESDRWFIRLVMVAGRHHQRSTAQRRLIMCAFEHCGEMTPCGCGLAGQELQTCQLEPRQL